MTVEQRRVLGAAGRHAASQFEVVIETRRIILVEGLTRSHGKSFSPQLTLIASEVLVTLQPARTLVTGHRSYTAAVTALVTAAVTALILLSSLCLETFSLFDD
jgi:hypothetical protein